MKDKKLKIGLFGTFEVDNYGDILFPVIFEKEIKKRGIKCQIYLFSPTAGYLKYDNRPVYSVRDDLPNVDLDFYIIGGGDIIRFDNTPVYSLERLGFPAYYYCWVIPTLYAVIKNKPIIWNAPGVPFEFSDVQNDLARIVTDASTYVSVRDEFSKRRLKLSGVESEIKVVPDTVFLLAKYLPKEVLKNDFNRIEKKLKIERDNPFLAFHTFRWFINGEYSLVANMLREIKYKYNLQIILLPIRYINNDDNEVIKQISNACPGEFIYTAYNLHPIETAAVISNANFFIGASLHGTITALNYGIPHLSVDTAYTTKLKNLFILTELERYYIENWNDFPSAFDSLFIEKESLPLVYKQKVGMLWDMLNSHFEQVYQCIDMHKKKQINIWQVN